MAEGLIAFGIPGSTAYKGSASLLQVTEARLLGKCSLSKSVFQAERIFLSSFLHLQCLIAGLEIWFLECQWQKLPHLPGAAFHQ